MGSVTKQLQVAGGAAVLLLLLISLSVCSVSSQTGLFHQSSSLYCLCHCSLFHSLPSSLHLSLSLSPSHSPLSLSLAVSLSLSAPSARTSNSMVKYPGQCVALQRDSGSRYAGKGPGSKWRVIVEHCGCTSRGPQSNHIKGPHLGQNLPQGIWNMGPKSHFSPSNKNPLIPRRDPFLFHFINQASRTRKFIWRRRAYVSFSPCRKVPSLCTSAYAVHPQRKTTESRSTFKWSELA